MTETAAPPEVKSDFRHILDMISGQGRLIGLQEATLEDNYHTIQRLRDQLVTTTVDADFHRGLSQIHAQEAARLRKKYEGGEKAKAKAVRKK